MGILNIGPTRWINDYQRNQKQAAMKRALHNTAQAYQAYRPEYTQARLNLGRQQASMFNPMNAALGMMYGPAAQFDIGAAMVNPMSQRMQMLGAPTNTVQAPFFGAGMVQKETPRERTVDKYSPKGDKKPR